MGCHPSKLKRPSVIRISENPNDSLRKNSKDLNVSGNVVSDSAIMVNHDQRTISDIRKDLNETPELFVLNNVLMCTHFLRNYPKDMKEIHHQINIREERFLEPDIVMEQANKNVTYRPLHGPNKEYPEPLVNKRMYVPVNNIIGVRVDTDKTENCGNKFEVQMEKSKRRGYVKLRRKSCDYDRTSLKDTLPLPLSSTSGSSDNESSTESNSTCTGPMEKSQFIKDQPDAGSLHDCFVFRKVKKPDADVNLEDMDHKNLTDDDVYDIVSYLPSRNFMKYFQSKIFRNYIAKELGLIQYEIDNSIVNEKIPGKIFCNLRDDNGNSNPVEVLPCLKIPWPEEETLNFLMRDPKECSEDQLFWPTNEMLREIGQLDCALVPKGYHKKRGVYPEGDLEWEIHFPLAERYLESFLRPEQIKCYLVLLTLHKEYIEPFTRKQGIEPEHYRTVLFWESEIDYDSWPEHRLGIKLMSIVKKINIALHRGLLPDYFMGKNRNVFRKIPKQYLLHANEVFHKITQSPLTWIVRALRNLRTTTGTFYPPLNYKELLDILYKKDWESSNPLLNNINIVEDTVSVSSSSLDRKPRFTDAEKQLQYVKERERKRRLMKKREKLNDKNISNLKYSVGVKERRGSEDSIDDNWECEKHFRVEKKIALLKFFINNYIDIASVSYRIGTKKQALFYLKQAWYLTKILEEENKLFAEEVKDFFAKISAEENKCKEAMQMNTLNDEIINEVNNNVEIKVELSGEQNKNLNKMMAIFSAISRKEEYCDNGVVHQQDIHRPKGISRSLSRSFTNNYPSISDSENAEEFR